MAAEVCDLEEVVLVAPGQDPFMEAPKVLLGQRHMVRRLEWYHWELGLGFGQTRAMIARIS